MDFSPGILRYDEEIIFKLRTLYSEHGYTPYKMSRFEEYELYAANRSFLPEGDIIAFTGAGGKLMALRPDVTLSIVKSLRGDDDELKKLYYNESVYRTVHGEMNQQMQVGLECIGLIGTQQTAQVIMLAKRSLDMLGETAQLDISHMGFPGGLLGSRDLSARQRAAIMRCISGKDMHSLRQLCESERIDIALYDNLMRLISLHGAYRDVKTELEQISSTGVTDAALGELEQLDSSLRSLGITEGINIDFSVVNDLTYYNGIVFRGYIKGIPSMLLSGGRYDELLRSFGKSGSAIGFAVYPDLVPHAGAGKTMAAEEMLSIALPKGRLGESAYGLFKTAGFECPDMEEGENSRKLSFENEQLGVRYFWVKPSDVAVYVERGAADIGVTGKDILLETHRDVYELLDLGLGKCRMCVAAKKGFGYNCHNQVLRVATKFPNIARGHFASRGSDIDIINLHGSVELAPLIGLADVIVDLVETGKTLSENNMEPVETIAAISARLIANKAAYRFSHEKIISLCRKLEKMCEG